MIDFKGTPIVLATTLFHHATEKVDVDKAISLVDGYFNLYRQKERIHEIGRELTLIASIAEVYTTDPINTLFQCGITIFPEFCCLKNSKLKDLLHCSIFNLKTAFKNSCFMEFKNIPYTFKQTLFKLGFTDSLNWSIYYIPQINDFSLHIIRHKCIVQTFPAELMSNLTESLSSFHQLIAGRDKIVASVMQDNIEKGRLTSIRTRSMCKKEPIDEDDDEEDYSYYEEEEEESSD